MESSNGNSHIPSVRSVQSNYSYDYGQWLMRYNWTYILTLRRHIPLTESACMKIASNLLDYSKEIESIWLALEKDRGDQMNHLHLIIESGTLHFTRKEIIEALGIKPFELDTQALMNRTNANNIL